MAAGTVGTEAVEALEWVRAYGIVRRALAACSRNSVPENAMILRAQIASDDLRIAARGLVSPLEALGAEGGDRLFNPRASGNGGIVEVYVSPQDSLEEGLAIDVFKLDDARSEVGSFAYS